MRESRQAYMTNVYPLIDLGMRRWDCQQWLTRHGYPIPSKSACIGCPFHSNEYWQALRDNSPAEWEDAVLADRELRLGSPRKMRAVEYMHPSRLPLDQVDLRSQAQKDGQLDLFGNECSGYCGT